MSLALPIAVRPWYLPHPERADAEAEAKNHLGGLVRSVMQPIIDEIIAKADHKGRARDGVDSSEALYRRCHPS